jgi:hypothetical protein
MTLPKVHLRDFFWLAVVVALGVGWYLDHAKARRKIEELQAQMERVELNLQLTRILEARDGTGAREVELRNAREILEEIDRLYPPAAEINHSPDTTVK